MDKLQRRARCLNTHIRQLQRELQDRTVTRPWEQHEEIWRQLQQQAQELQTLLMDTVTDEKEEEVINQCLERGNHLHAIRTIILQMKKTSQGSRSKESSNQQGYNIPGRSVPFGDCICLCHIQPIQIWGNCKKCQCDKKHERYRETNYRADEQHVTEIREPSEIIVASELKYGTEGRKPLEKKKFPYQVEVSREKKYDNWGPIANTTTQRTLHLESRKGGEPIDGTLSYSSSSLNASEFFDAEDTQSKYEDTVKGENEIPRRDSSKSETAESTCSSLSTGSAESQSEEDVVRLPALVNPAISNNNSSSSITNSYDSNTHNSINTFSSQMHHNQINEATNQGNYPGRQTGKMNMCGSGSSMKTEKNSDNQNTRSDVNFNSSGHLNSNNDGNPNIIPDINQENNVVVVFPSKINDPGSKQTNILKQSVTDSSKSSMPHARTHQGFQQQNIFELININNPASRDKIAVPVQMIRLNIGANGNNSIGGNGVGILDTNASDGSEEDARQGSNSETSHIQNTAESSVTKTNHTQNKLSSRYSSGKDHSRSNEGGEGVSAKQELTPDGIIAELNINGVESEDGGAYFCKASNVYGKDRQTIQLQIQEPPKIPSSLEIVTTTSGSIQLQWKLHQQSEERIKYLVQYREGEDGPDWQTIEAGESLSVTITDLKPATKYSVRVLAEGSAGRSSPSGILSVKTALQRPGGPPLHVDVKPISSTEILLTWSPPLPGLRYGDILGYNIGFKESSASTSSYVFTNVYGNGEEGGEFLLTGLSKYTRFSIVIQAFNQVGPSPLSEPILTQTLEDVPSMPPEDIRCNALSPQSLQISWQPPPPAHCNGILQGYKVHIEPLREEGPETGDAGPKQATALTLIAPELKRLTNYSVQVLAFTRVGDGAMTRPIYCLTEEDEPLHIIQRMCQEREYSELLHKAAELDDPYERMISAFPSNGSSHYGAGSKPFDPLLGETYECTREDKGFKCIPEQVPHHRPISGSHAEGKSFIYWRDGRIKAKFLGESVEFQHYLIISYKGTQKDKYDYDEEQTGMLGEGQCCSDCPGRTHEDSKSQRPKPSSVYPDVHKEERSVRILCCPRQKTTRAISKMRILNLDRRLGRITSTQPDKHGHVRIATIKTATGSTTRAISKLVKLIPEQDSQSS